MWSDGAFDSPSGIGKAQLTHLIEGVQENCRLHEPARADSWEPHVQTPRACKTIPLGREIFFSGQGAKKGLRDYESTSLRALHPCSSV